MGVGRMAPFCTSHKQFERKRISEKYFSSPKGLQWEKEMSFTWKKNEKNSLLKK
jgi:hypothetical protein